MDKTKVWKMLDLLRRALNGLEIENKNCFCAQQNLGVSDTGFAGFFVLHYVYFKSKRQSF